MTDPAKHPLPPFDEVSERQRVLDAEPVITGLATRAKSYLSENPPVRLARSQRR